VISVNPFVHNKAEIEDGGENISESVIAVKQRFEGFVIN
jgi:hypothetical protein